MSTTYDFILALHIYSLYASGFLMLFYLFLSQNNSTTEFNFIYRIRVFLPIFYMFLAFVLFTGLLLLSINYFNINLYHTFMIFTWILILALAIVQFKSFKKARKMKRYRKFKRISFFILIIEIGLLFAPNLLIKYF